VAQKYEPGGEGPEVNGWGFCVQKGRRFRGSERFIQASMYIFHIFSLFFNEKNLITRALI